MKLTRHGWFGADRWMGLRLALTLCLIWMGLGWRADAQAVSTTTVQGTVYLANGQPGAGTMDVSWPAFTTANDQAVAAGRVTVTIAQDGFMSVNLAPNLGATPAGLYYTAVYQMSDGTTSTEYWVVPAAAQASVGQVRAQVMPAAQAVQAVTKAYVDQSISQLAQSLLTATGGTVSGPLYLSGDPTQPLQAADKHYVDTTFAEAVPLTGASMTGALAAPALNGVQAPSAGSGQTTLQATVTAAGSNGAVEIPPTYSGTDTFTNPNGVYVTDLRRTGAQQFERSVKEFGAVCDGETDDTAALQSAINYAQAHGVALTIPQGTCKTQALTWHGESIGGLGKQVSALKGFPGQDVLVTAVDSATILPYTRLHDLTIYVDQSVDISCSAAKGRARAGSCLANRPMEANTIFAPGGNGLNGTAGTGMAWGVGNCAIAMPALTGAGGNGLRVAEIENLEMAATGMDPLAMYGGAHSTHSCGMYLAQWPQWSEFRNIDIRRLNTGIALPALPGSTPAGLNADSNRWQDITIEATHGFTAAAGSNNSLDNLVLEADNSAATGEPPTGLVLDFAGSQQGWTMRNAVVLPTWDAVQPQLTATAAGEAVTAVTAGPEHGLGFDPYGTQVALKFSGSCTAQAAANVNTDGSIGTINVTQGGVGCSGTTTASVNAAGTWDTAAPVNLIGGQNMTLLSGNLLKGNGGYTVWNATNSESYGAEWGGGGTLPGGGSYPALVASSGLGTTNQVDQFPGADFGAKLQACLNTLSSTYGGTCDARNFTGTVSMGSNLTISTSNATVLLPCATVSTASHVVVTAETRNVALRGCALRGGSTVSGAQGGTVFLYSGANAMLEVGDPTYAADTNGFHLDNVVINTTAAAGATAQGLVAYRTQEMDLESLYFLGNLNQTGMTLDGTGNYTGGSFLDNELSGFQIAVNATGHQISNPATTDWMNASTFVRLHIDCPTSSGNPIAGTIGINLQQGDGNTFTGGDVEGCSTALHLGPNAQNNTIVGLRNENSSNQVVADAGSSYNNWMTGGTMFTGQLTDNGTRNSFLDTFHRSFNGLNGDWYGSQQDATVTNHFRLGTGTGNERGLLNRYQTDYGYRWTMGLSDATAGEQFYQLLDELNSVYRLSIGQYNHGQSSTNNQTVINAAGTGAIVLNGSTNAGTGGVVFGSGGSNETTVATVNNAGNAQFNGTLQVGGTSTFTGSTTVKNQADAEIDQFLWAGASTPQKESFIYKDWNGNSQWYMVKDTGNNWALNSAVGGLDSFKAYQSTNSGDTYIDASNSTGVVRVNYETGAGSGFNVYGGGATSPLYASFTGTTSIKFPGLAASSGHSCLQIDNSGYITNTGSSCGSGTGGSGTVSGGTSGQIAYYTATGTQVGGTTTVPVTAGGTGATTAATALTNLGALSVAGGTLTGPINGTTASFGGAIAAGQSVVVADGVTPLQVTAFGAKCDGATDDASAIIAAINAANTGSVIQFPTKGTCVVGTLGTLSKSVILDGQGATIEPNTTGAWVTIPYIGPQPPEFKNLTITQFGSVEPADIFVLSGQPKVALQNVVFSKAQATHSLIWNESAYGLSLDSTLFYNNTAPQLVYFSHSSSLATYSFAASMRNIDMSNNTATCITMEGGSLSIKDSVIESCSGGGLQQTSYDILGLEIDHVHFEANLGYNIQFSTTAGTFAVASITNSLFLGSPNQTALSIGSLTSLTFNGNYVDSGCINAGGTTFAGSIEANENRFPGGGSSCNATTGNMLATAISSAVTRNGSNYAVGWVNADYGPAVFRFLGTGTSDILRILGQNGSIVSRLTTYGLETSQINTSGAALALGGAVTVPNGTAAAPSLAFSSYPTSGLYSNSGAVNISVLGGVRAQFDSGGFHVSGPMDAGFWGDTFISRAAANTLSIDTNEAGNSEGRLRVSAVVASGAQTISGCSLSSAKGGASAGQFNSGVSGTCTVTVTAGFTAPNGFRCSATDLTTFSNAIQQTGTSTTGCTLIGTTGSGDLVTWQAIAY